MDIQTLGKMTWQRLANEHRDSMHLAMEARVIDMRASPYDLTEFGEYDPIMIESPEGRAEYERLQKLITAKGVPLRTELAEKIKQVIELTTLGESTDQSREFVSETD